MSTLKQRLLDDMKTAMRAKDALRLETIRMVRAAVQRREVDDRAEMDESGVLQVVQKLVKQCTDAADQFVKGNRQDLADKELANIRILEDYLPEKLSDEALDEMIKQAITDTAAESMKDMGKVMAALRDKVQGRADMGALSGRIKGLLS